MCLDDYDTDLTPEMLHSRINMAIEKFTRQKHTVRCLRTSDSLNIDVTLQQNGSKNHHRSNEHKKYRDGVVKCNGCRFEIFLQRQ